MPTYPFQSSFNAGEFSPRLEGRVDIARYQNAVRTCRNFVIFPHGGVTRRPGFRFVREVKDSADATRLIPFEFNDVQAYELEVGDQYIRVYKDGGIVESSPGVPVEIATPYLTAEVFDLQYVQSADTLYIVHRNHAPRKLTRTSHTSWTLSVIDLLDGPYLPERTDLTITPSATTGNGITLTASASLFVAGHVGMLFRIRHGATWGYVKVTAVANGTSATADVKKTLGATTASDSFREGALGTKYGFPSVTTFDEARFYLGATNNNPATLWGSKSADFENFAPGSNDDDGIAATVASNKVNILRWLASSSRALTVGTLGSEFRLEGANDEHLTPSNAHAHSATTYGSRAVVPVLVDARVLFVQRSGRKLRELSFVDAEQSYRAPNLSLLADHLFPKDTSIIEMAFQADPDPIVWCVRSDGVLLGLTYDRTQDVVGWAAHTTDGVVESISVIPHPSLDSDQVWAIVKRTINGSTKRYVEYFDLKGNPYSAYEQLNTDSALTYDGTQQTTLTLSAVSGTGVTATAGSSVFAAGDVGKEIRVPGGGRAEIVGYTSGTEVTVDVKKTFASASVAAGGWGIAVFAVAGLGHLEGKTVAVVGDGSVYSDAVVASGAVTLDPAISALRIEVGLPYTSTLETLRPEVQLRDGGTSQGRKKRWNEVVVRVYQTLGLKVLGDTIPFRKAGDAMDAPPPLVSQDIRKTNLGWDREGRITVEQPYPLPATINGLTGTLEVTEG